MVVVDMGGVDTDRPVGRACGGFAAGRASKPGLVEWGEWMKRDFRVFVG